MSLSDKVIGSRGRIQIHHAQPVAVVVAGHQRQPEAGAEQLLGPFPNAVTRNLVQHQIQAHGNTPSWVAAVPNSPVSGPRAVASGALFHQNSR